jgi:hypothetical protein
MYGVHYTEWHRPGAEMKYLQLFPVAHLSPEQDVAVSEEIKCRISIGKITKLLYRGQSIERAVGEWLPDHALDQAAFASLCRLVFACRRGRMRRNVVPLPGALSTLMCPLWASTTSLTIFVPSPVPPGFRLSV